MRKLEQISRTILIGMARILCTVLLIVVLPSLLYMWAMVYTTSFCIVVGLPIFLGLCYLLGLNPINDDSHRSEF